MYTYMHRGYQCTSNLQWLGILARVVSLTRICTPFWKNASVVKTIPWKMVALHVCCGHTPVFAMCINGLQCWTETNQWNGHTHYHAIVSYDGYAVMEQNDSQKYLLKWYANLTDCYSIWEFPLSVSDYFQYAKAIFVFHNQSEQEVGGSDNEAAAMAMAWRFPSPTHMHFWCPHPVIMTHSLQAILNFDANEGYGLRGSALDDSLHCWATGSDVLLSYWQRCPAELLAMMSCWATGNDVLLSVQALLDR